MFVLEPILILVLQCTMVLKGEINYISFFNFTASVKFGGFKVKTVKKFSALVFQFWSIFDTFTPKFKSEVPEMAAWEVCYFGQMSMS